MMKVVLCSTFKDLCIQIVYIKTKLTCFFTMPIPAMLKFIVKKNDTILLIILFTLG